MSRVLAHALGVAACLAAAGPACTGPDVTLATLPAGEDAQAPLRCVTSKECPAGSYCDKPSCDSAAGTCTFYPPDCPAEEQLSCGCDGVTYFSDCLRRASGIASSTSGPCPMGMAETCGGTSGKTCTEEGAICGLLTGMGPGACPPAPEGTCWILPAQCPADPGAIMWDSCLPGQHCLDTCKALRMGGSYRGSLRCP